MTIYEVVNQFCEMRNYNKVDSRLFVRDFFDYLVEKIAQGNDVDVYGFGKFYLLTRKKTVAGNFGRGNVTVPDRNDISFKTYKSLKRKLNGIMPIERDGEEDIE